jgi:hypothetical protein
VVDPNVRLAKGLPILSVAAEIDRYENTVPGFHKDHDVCLWEVTGEEVVDHWS